MLLTGQNLFPQRLVVGLGGLPDRPERVPAPAAGHYCRRIRSTVRRCNSTPNRSAT
jgi:hypothetical protein